MISSPIDSYVIESTEIDEDNKRVKTILFKISK